MSKSELAFLFFIGFLGLVFSLRVLLPFVFLIIKFIVVSLVNVIEKFFKILFD